MCLCLRWQRYLTLLLYFSSRNKGLCVVTRWTQNVTLKNTAWENLAWCVQVFITQFLFSCPLYIGQNIRCCNIQLDKLFVCTHWTLFTFFIQCPKNTFVQDGVSCDGGKVIQFFIHFLRFILMHLFNYVQSETKGNKQTTYKTDLHCN